MHTPAHKRIAKNSYNRKLSFFCVSQTKPTKKKCSKKAKYFDFICNVNRMQCTHMQRKRFRLENFDKIFHGIHLTFSIFVSFRWFENDDCECIWSLLFVSPSFVLSAFSAFVFDAVPKYNRNKLIIVLLALLKNSLYCFHVLVHAMSDRLSRLCDSEKGAATVLLNCIKCNCLKLRLNRLHSIAIVNLHTPNWACNLFVARCCRPSEFVIVEAVAWNSSQQIKIRFNRFRNGRRQILKIHFADAWEKCQYFDLLWQF